MDKCEKSKIVFFIRAESDLDHMVPVIYYLLKGLSGSLNAILTNNYYELDTLAENQSV